MNYNTWHWYIRPVILKHELILRVKYRNDKPMIYESRFDLIILINLDKG